LRIDAILPTFNRANLVVKALESALAAAVPADCEVRFFVVDNNSRDETRAAIASLSEKYENRITYLFEPKQGRHHALNTGIAHSTADLIAFFDDDERLPTDWFEVIAGAFRDETVDYVGGPVRPDWTAPAPLWLPRDGYGGVLGIIDNGAERRRYGASGFLGMPTGGNFAIRKHVLDRCGPYSPEFMYSEDRYMYEQLIKIDAAGFYLPELLIYHLIPSKRLQKGYFRRWAHTEGRNRGKLARQARRTPGSLLGAPLWKWRQVAGAVGTILAGLLSRSPDHSGRFKAELDVIQFLGFYSGRNLRFIKDRYVDRA
jgi:glycosyltransferase involved in cell wall biosynthesis